MVWKHGDAIELEANPYYWRGKPKLDRITLKLLPWQETLMNQMQTGENDLWPLVPPSYIERLRNVPGVDVSVQPNFRTTNLDFVYTRAIVDDPRVREAVRAALNRPRMVATVLSVARRGRLARRRRRHPRQGRPTPRAARGVSGLRRRNRRDR